MAAPNIPIAADTAHRNWKPPEGPYRVFVSVPCDDGHKLGFWDSLRALERASLRGELRNRYRIKTRPGDSLVPRARNYHAHEFYYQTADDVLLSLDSDLDFRPSDLDLLLENPGPVMAGRYAIKQAELRWCLNGIPGEEVDSKTQRQFVSTAGTGFLATFRHVIGTMIAEGGSWSHWRVKYNDDADGSVINNLYFAGVVQDTEYFPDRPLGRYLSEDWAFCYFARKLGFPVQVDHRVTALHIGEARYPLAAHRLTEAEVRAGVQPVNL